MKYSPTATVYPAAVPTAIEAPVDMVTVTIDLSKFGPDARAEVPPTGSCVVLTIPAQSHGLLCIPSDVEDRLGPEVVAFLKRQASRQVTAQVIAAAMS